MTYGRRKGLISGGGMGVVMFIVFVIYCVIFWYGCKLVREEEDNYTAGTMLIVSLAKSLLGHRSSNKKFLFICKWNVVSNCRIELDLLYLNNSDSIAI